MVPLEVTHSAIVTPAVLERVRALSSSFASLCVDLLMFFSRTYRDVFGFTDGPPLHDPVSESIT